MTQHTDLEDVCLWPDGTWCYRSEKYEMDQIRSGYEVLYFGTDEYEKFFKEQLVTDYDITYGKVIATFPHSFVANFLYNQVVKVHCGVPIMKENYESIYEYDTCRWVFYYSIDDTGIHIEQCDVRRFDD